MIKTYFCEWRKAYVAYDDNDEPNENGWQQHGGRDRDQLFHAPRASSASAI